MSITAGTFVRMPVPSPSREEQQKIADCLTSFDEVISAQGRKVEALKTHKRGLMQQLFPSKAKLFPASVFPNFAMRRSGNLSVLTRWRLYKGVLICPRANSNMALFRSYIQMESAGTIK